MQKNLIYLIVAAVILVVVVSQSAYVVNETQQVVVTQFGRPVGEAITTPGLKFKVPFIQKTNFIEKRFLEWDGDPNQIPTKDKKFIFVDTYARWQIVDPLRYFIRFTNERSAMSRLADILDGETRDFIASHNLEEAVRTSNREPVSSGIIGDMIGDSLMHIEVGRDRIQRMIRESANEQARELGLEILDFKIKRINYVPEVREQVYNRMISERMRIADEFRSEGQGEASVINGEKERELQTIQSVAFRQAEEIMGRADAEAAAIYTAAYNRSNAARELYAFLKSLETFEKTLDKETQVILSTNSDLYKYLKRMH
ncbi:protease modulator HflC [Alkalitalea saponilacus]|uniref:Protein HflC n=1 Tax=Alkalitalea saponilacus TaxID=889453 RepID=A0A1T5HKF0_9BACT|nr:protease modulator HflC [Alkalitalea saponilacus]ASB47767.1 HflC protein [Alkalitalea saponilacus]SKC21116.1 membrane protease subunit HflC [Alkalitalea saponilacus]